jgi:hypothetical protein
VSWVKLGFQLSLDCLNAGANDFSGTLMEESISKAAGANFGEFVEPAEFRRMIRSIGRTPAERTTSYKIRRTFDAAPESEPIASSQVQTSSAAASDSASVFPLLNAGDTQPAHQITHGESAY